METTMNSEKMAAVENRDGWGICDVCGELHALTETGDGKHVCNVCLAENYTACENCGEYYPTAEMVETKNGYACKDCIASDYACCATCGEFICVNSDTTYDIDGEYVCVDCLEGSGDWCYCDSWRWGTHSTKSIRTVFDDLAEDLNEADRMMTFQKDDSDEYSDDYMDGYDEGWDKGYNIGLHDGRDEMREELSLAAAKIKK